ncbi:MAG: hypothetical protein R6X21_08390 [Candidatus Aminicenantes bacterium]
MHMRKTAAFPRRALLLAAACAFLGLSTGRPAQDPAGQDPPPQEIQKPRYDYMSTLSRSTRPLGLKEDPTTRKILAQGVVKWAIRAGSRHILN